MSKKNHQSKLVRGLIGTRQDHRATVRGLGLRRVNSVSELEDTPAVRGMITVSYRSPLSLRNAENNMQLNNLKPAEGSKHAKRRVGCGRFRSGQADAFFMALSANARRASNTVCNSERLATTSASVYSSSKYWKLP